LESASIDGSFGILDIGVLDIGVLDNGPVGIDSDTNREMTGACVCRSSLRPPFWP